MQFVRLVVVEAQVQFALHRIRSVAPDEVGSQAGGAAEFGAADGYVLLRVAERIEHVAGHDHDGARLEPDWLGVRELCQAGGQLFVLCGVEPVPVRLQGLGVHTLMSIPCPLVRSDEASRNDPGQAGGERAKDLPGPW